MYTYATEVEIFMQRSLRKPNLQAAGLYRLCLKGLLVLIPVNNLIK